MVAAVQLGSGNCSAVVTQLLLLLSLSLGLSGSSGRGCHQLLHPPGPCGAPRLPGLLSASMVFAGLKNGSCQLSLLCALQKPRSAGKAGELAVSEQITLHWFICCLHVLSFPLQQWIPLCSVFIFVLRILITFTNRQWDYFHILCCIHEFF